MAVRRIAFVAFVASVLSLLAPSWNLIETISGLVSSGRVWWWQAVPWTVSTWLFSAIMPAFYFALYRSGETLVIPKPMRLLSRAGAITAFLFVASALYVEHLDPDFAARGGIMDTGARAFSHVVSILNVFSETALWLLLASFCFEPNCESAVEAPGFALACTRDRNRRYRLRGGSGDFCTTCPRYSLHLFLPQHGSSRERADDAAVLQSATGSNPNTRKSGVPVYRALCGLEEPAASASRT